MGKKSQALGRWKRKSDKTAKELEALKKVTTKATRKQNIVSFGVGAAISTFIANSIQDKERR